MIGTYTKHFGDCRHVAQCLAAEGSDKSYFFGGATGVSGESRLDVLERETAGLKLRRLPACVWS